MSLTHSLTHWKKLLLTTTNPRREISEICEKQNLFLWCKEPFKHSGQFCSCIGEKFSAILRMVSFERYTWYEFMTSGILVRGRGASWRLAFEVWIWTSENNVVYMLFVFFSFKKYFKTENMKLKIEIKIWIYGSKLMAWSSVQSSKYFK